MFWKKSISIIASVLLLFISACSMAGGPAGDNGTGKDSTAAIDTRVAEIVASTAAAQTAIANAVAATLTAMATNTTESTFTPSLTLTPSLTRRPSKTPTSTSTPTLTFTRTPKVPMVSVSVQTNCRVGPGTTYDGLGIMNVGETAQVVGRSASSDYWIIKLPSNPAITCWLWGKYATVVGNKSGLPVIAPPPTPTPAASFNVVFASIENCGPGIYEIKLQINNNGSVTWESNKVSARDNVTTQTNTAYYDNFPNFSGVGCAPVSTDLNLDPGEVGHTSTSSFGANPAGHSITVAIRVCSLNGLAGTCLEKTITFTP